MRSMHGMVLAAIVCQASAVTGQTLGPCAPLTLQPTAVPSPSTYYTSVPPVGNAPVGCSPAISAYYPAGSPPVVYPPYSVYRPVLPVAPVASSYYVGRGVLGQPKLYVPGQPLRNFLRYLSP